MERRKEELRDQLPQEPDAEDPDAIRILLKLPSGIRLERRFLKTDSLQVNDMPLKLLPSLTQLSHLTQSISTLFQHLHNYVLVHEAAPDDFQIVTNFPRRVLPTQSTDDTPVPPSFESVGLGKSELLFVHDNTA